MRHEQRDILAALPQSRDRDMDDGDPEVKVLPEDALGDRLPEVSVGGRDDADVDPLRLASPDHHELPGLDHPQQTGEFVMVGGSQPTITNSPVWITRSSLA